MSEHAPASAGPAGAAGEQSARPGAEQWIAERRPGGWVLGQATTGQTPRPLTVRYADGRTMTYRAQLPIAVKAVREGTLLFDVAADLPAMTRAAVDRPGEFVARLLQEKKVPVASKDIRAELHDLGVVDLADGQWWKLAQRDLRADPHVAITGSKYAWSATPSVGVGGRSGVAARRVAGPEELLAQAAVAGRGDGAHAARVHQEVGRAVAQGRFPDHLAPLARAVLEPSSLTGADLPGELLDVIPPDLAPLVLTAGRRLGDTRVVLGAWLLAREPADREAARDVLARRDPGELSACWREWGRRRAREVSPPQRSAQALDRLLEQGQRLLELPLPEADVLAGLFELLAALVLPMEVGAAVPQTYDEALDWVCAQVRLRAGDVDALTAGLDGVDLPIATAVGSGASAGSDGALGSDWSPAGLRRKWVLALAASAHRAVLDDARIWERISLSDLAQSDGDGLTGTLLGSAPGPGLVEAMLDETLAQPSARAVGLVLCLDPSLLGTVRPGSFARALVALAAADGPARDLMAAYDSHVRTGLSVETGLRLDQPSPATQDTLPR